MAIEDITRDDIKKEHIENALNDLAQHGQRNTKRFKQGIIYLYNNAHARGIKYRNHGKDEYFSPRSVLRVAALYAAGEIPEGETASKEQYSNVPNELIKSNVAFLRSRGFRVYRLNKGGVMAEVDSDEEESEDVGDVDEALSLLRQFGQIILCGPPGTGKTHLAQKVILPQLLDVDEGEIYSEGVRERWDIVQFHPSYNYEDFVRGVKIKTSGGKIDYEISNRAFGEICQKAAKDENNDAYVLIIDEINRANVSAVLGELIYALEYRDKEINTPYAVEGDSKLVIPKNLYIVGTMNTADRTIGQIDYAVRRRFAFVSCSPDRSLIQENYNNALGIFDLVDRIFDKEEGHVSPDYDPEDVRIGHSYFIGNSKQLEYKVLYQVVPILQEYIKDGVLLKEAEKKISEIIEQFPVSEPENGIQGKEKPESGKKGEKDDRRIGCWERGEGIHIDSIGRVVLSIAHDYVERNKNITFQDLQEWFPDRNKHLEYRGIQRQYKDADKYRFFRINDEPLIVESKPAYVTREWKWGEPKGSNPGSFRNFVKDIQGKDGGYTARLGYVVHIHQKEGLRSWDSCYEFGIVSVNGSGALDQSDSRNKFLELEKGAIIFAYLGNKEGFIAMGEVLEKAVPINEFKKNNLPLLNHSFVGTDEKYRDRYPLALQQAYDKENCELVLAVKWRHRVPLKEAKGTGTPAHIVYSNISESNLNILKEAFNGK